MEEDRYNTADLWMRTYQLFVIKGFSIHIDGLLTGCYASVHLPDFLTIYFNQMVKI